MSQYRLMCPELLCDERTQALLAGEKADGSSAEAGPSANQRECEPVSGTLSVTRDEFIANPAAVLEQAAVCPIAVRGDNGELRMLISTPSDYDPCHGGTQECGMLHAAVPDMHACERAIADLALLQELRAHPALDWHVTDIEGARDAAESPEAREICEMTMKLLGGEP